MKSRQELRFGRLPSWIFAALIVAEVYAAGSNAVAVPVEVINLGFEDIVGEVPFNEFTFGPLHGWDLYDPAEITGGGAGGTYYIGTLTPFEPDPIGNPGVYANFTAGAAEGQRVGIAFNFAGSGGQGEYGFVQMLNATLQAHTRYRLEVEIGNIASATAMSGEFFPLDGFPGYRVDLLAGDTVIAQDVNRLGGLIDEGQFGTSRVMFTTGATHPLLGEHLGIRLVNLNEVDPLFPESDLEVDFDHVRLDAAAALPGDYNDDGLVDAADYVVWRRHVGAPAGTLPHDTDGGAIGAAQYSTWQANFGGSAVIETARFTVPEPAAPMLLLCGLAGGMYLLPRKQAHKRPAYSRLSPR